MYTHIGSHSIYAQCTIATTVHNFVYSCCAVYRPHIIAYMDRKHLRGMPLHCWSDFTGALNISTMYRRVTLSPGVSEFEISSVGMMFLE